MEENDSSYTLMMITHTLTKKRSDLKDRLYLGGRRWNKEIYYQHVTRESFSSAVGRAGWKWVGPRTKEESPSFVGVGAQINDTTPDHYRL